VSQIHYNQHFYVLAGSYRKTQQTLNASYVGAPAISFRQKKPKADVKVIHFGFIVKL
jgi:hypothetical protein